MFVAILYDFFQNFSFDTSPVIELERNRNENNELIIRKLICWAVMNRLCWNVCMITASVRSNLWFFQNFSFAIPPVIELERYKNENNVLLIRKFFCWAVLNGLSGLFIWVYIRQMPVYNHNGWTYSSNN